MDEPMVRVVRGAPTTEEVAALVGAVLARGTTGVPAASTPGRAGRGTPSGWRMSALPVAPPRPGPGAWRASGLPR